MAIPGALNARFHGSFKENIQSESDSDAVGLGALNPDGSPISNRWELFQIFTDFSSVGVGPPALIRPYDEILFEVIGGNTPNKTFRFQFGCSPVLSDISLWLGSAGSSSAPWVYGEVTEIGISPEAVIVVSGGTLNTTVPRFFKLLNKGFWWGNFRVITNAGGTVSVRIYGKRA